MHTKKNVTAGVSRIRIAGRLTALFAARLATIAFAMPASAATLERIKETGHIKLGYIADARPFSHSTEAGAPEGYTIDLCQRIAAKVKTSLSMSELTVDWVPVTLDSRLDEVQKGQVDLLCSPTSVTLARRQEVSFSIPVFGGGNRAVLRADAPEELRQALSDSPTPRPVWRGSPASKVLNNTSFVVVAGSTAEGWLQAQRIALQVDAKITSVESYQVAVQQVVDRKADVLFGDRAIILGAMDDTARRNLVIFDRLFTQEQAGLALARNDDDFRLLVDSTLSELYASSEFNGLYEKWFGPLDSKARTFFVWNSIDP